MATASTDGKVISLAATYAQRDLAISIPGSRWNKDAQLWEMPLTWAACVQLRGLFGADLEMTTELCEWAWNERQTRIDPAMRFRSMLKLESEEPDSIATHVSSWIDRIESEQDSR